MNKSKILVIEQEKDIREIISHNLQSKGYEVILFPTTKGVIRLLRENPDIDAVFSDVLLAGERGGNFLGLLRKEFPYLPIIIITTTMDLRTAFRCMQEGAFSYIIKPFLYPEEIHIILERAIEIKTLKKKNRELVEKLRSRTLQEVSKLKEIFLGSLNALVKTMEIRDEYLVGHSRRVANISLEISRKIGLTKNLRKKILLGGNFHDIGRLGIRDDIARKNGPLNEEEFNHLKRHPLISVEIVSPVIKDDFILKTIKHHHERFDGGGYPDGLKGKEIPLGARIMAVADAYEAMTSRRPHRGALPQNIAREEIERNSGRQFDPEIVKVFLSLTFDSFR